MKDIVIDRNFTYSSTVTVNDESGNPVDLSAYQIYLDIYDKYGTLQQQLSSSSNEISISQNTINILISNTADLKSGYYILYAVGSDQRIVLVRGSLSVFPEVNSNLHYLIPALRVKIGDVSGERYEDEWLIVALGLAVKISNKYFGGIKYIVDENNVVSRNELYIGFTEEDTIIETKDEPIIIILAAIIVLEGSLENSAWSAVSWKDAEISFSNLEQFRTRGDILDKLFDELNSLTLPPVKRLGKSMVAGMTGYVYPEKDGKY